MASLTLSSDERRLFNEVANFTVKAAVPLVWHDVYEPWPKRLHGATCFVLRFDTGLIGITANHVVEAFERAMTSRPDFLCLLRMAALDLLEAILDRDADLDIATFKVTESELAASGATPIDCRGTGWPPPTPDISRAISFGGFPEAIKLASSHRLVKYNAFVYLARAEDVTEHDIIVTYDPARDSRMRAAAELPELGANLSGCSGGPVLMHVERSGLHRWFPVGMVIKGPGNLPDDVPRLFDMYRVRRIHVVQPDGTIHKRKGNGWLP